MGIPLADNSRLDINKFSPRSFLHPLNLYGNAVRDLIGKQPKRLFAYQLRHNLALRLVCHGILIIVHRSLWQILENNIDKPVRVLRLQRGNRHNLRKIQYIPVCLNKFQDFLFFYRVYLVDNKYNRNIHRF